MLALVATALFSQANLTGWNSLGNGTKVQLYAVSDFSTKQSWNARGWPLSKFIQSDVPNSEDPNFSGLEFYFAVQGISLPTGTDEEYPGVVGFLYRIGGGPLQNGGFGEND